MAISPKRPKGPPLNAMRAFEAAARNVSFVAAGEELNVTPGAISQHIKTLETWAGAQLFTRNAQGVELTEEGKSLVPIFVAAFDALTDASRGLRNLKPNADFHIAALPSVAQLWLPKRLGKIRACLPHISFSVTALEDPPSLAREMFDMTIFIRSADPSPELVTLSEDSIVPVYAPALSRRRQSLESAVLLQDQTWNQDWVLWSEHTSTNVGDPNRGPQFSLYSLAVEEAKAGAGILMGHECLIEDALSTNALIRASDAVAVTGHSLIVELPPVAKRRPEADQIVALLMDKKGGNASYLELGET